MVRSVAVSGQRRKSKTCSVKQDQMMNFSLYLIYLAAFIALVPAAVVAEADCDVENGKKQFNKCIACHSVEAGTHLMGPALHGLIGRKVGSAPGYIFSPAMEESDFVWTEQVFGDFLKAPMQYVPGTVMPFGGIKNDEQRDALVCYVKQFK
jgi:cytochrome c